MRHPFAVLVSRNTSPHPSRKMIPSSAFVHYLRPLASENCANRLLDVSTLIFVS